MDGETCIDYHAICERETGAHLVHVSSYLGGGGQTCVTLSAFFERRTSRGRDRDHLGLLFSGELYKAVCEGGRNDEDQEVCLRWKKQGQERSEEQSSALTNQNERFSA
jgi:hypothetical protein